MGKENRNQQNDIGIGMQLPKDLPSLPAPTLRAKVMELLKIENALREEYRRRINQMLQANKIDDYFVDEIGIQNYVPGETAIEFRLKARQKDVENTKIQLTTLAKLRELFPLDDFNFDHGSIDCEVEDIEIQLK